MSVLPAPEDQPTKGPGWETEPEPGEPDPPIRPNEPGDDPHD